MGGELIYDKAMRDSLEVLGASEGDVIFSPFIFKREDLTGELADSQLAQQELMGLGQVATTVKRRFIAELNQLHRSDDDDAQNDVPVIQLKRAHARGNRVVVNKFPGALDSLEFREGPRIKTTKRHQLSCDEIMQVIDAVKVDKLAYREVAIKYGVSTGLVQRLITANKKVPAFRQMTR